MQIENLLKRRKKKPQCAPWGTITAVYLNSLLYHSKRDGIHDTLTANGSLDDIQYANTGCIFWHGRPENRGLPVGWVSIKKNLWCGGTRLAEITGSTWLVNRERVSVTEKKEWLMSQIAVWASSFISIKWLWYLSTPTQMCQEQFVQPRRIKTAFCRDNAASLCT